MSNIGFMQRCVECIEDIYKKCMDNPKVSPSQLQKDEYTFLVEQFEIMFTHNEIEDIDLYKQLYKRLKNNDLTTLVDFRRKLRKTKIRSNK